MATFPGKSDLRSAPYSKFYNNPSGVNLTTEIHQAQNACSGLVLIATGAAAALTYKDCGGNSVAITGIDDNAVIYLDVGAIELTSSTTMQVHVRWHASTAR